MAYREQNEALTRLRLLASDPVVRAAENLHLADDAIAEAALGSGPATDLPKWGTLRSRQKQAREQLIIQARQLLGLSGGVPVVTPVVFRSDAWRIGRRARPS